MNAETLRAGTVYEWLGLPGQHPTTSRICIDSMTGDCRINARIIVDGEPITLVTIDPANLVLAIDRGWLVPVPDGGLMADDPRPPDDPALIPRDSDERAADDPRPRAELVHEIIEQLRWCEGQIGTSWLFDYNLPDLYRLLTELYATSTDANDGVRPLATAALAAMKASDGR